MEISDTKQAAAPGISTVVAKAPIDSAGAELQRLRTRLPCLLELAESNVASGQLPLIGWGLSRPRVQKLTYEGHPWFFVGDIHGDFLAWYRLLERVRREPNFRLCFLGDMVDRGPFSLECFASILEASMAHPGQILWILGNHDEALFWNSKDEKFRAKVEPAEFADWLNEAGASMGSPEQIKRWGKLFIEVASRLPRAVLFEDGLLATHGGVPLADCWVHLKTMEAFHNPRCLGDFTWTRATEVPKKLGWKFDPVRRVTSSTFEYGYKDLEGFAEAVVSVLPVMRVIRGHDHVESGLSRPACYKAVPLLTINGFGFHYLSNSVHQYRSSLVIGVARIGDLPEIEEITVNLDEHLGIYPPESKETLGTVEANRRSERSGDSPTPTPDHT